MIVFVDELGSWFIEDLHSLGSNYRSISKLYSFQVANRPYHHLENPKGTYNGSLKKEGS